MSSVETHLDCQIFPDQAKVFRFMARCFGVSAHAVQKRIEVELLLNDGAFFDFAGVC